MPVRVDIPSPYPPEESLRRIEACFSGSLGRVGMSLLARPSWERRVIGRIDRDSVTAKMAGSVDLALDQATPRYLRMFWGLIPGAWSFNRLQARVTGAESGAGSHLVGQMIGAPVWIVLVALTVWLVFLGVAILLFLNNQQPLPFAVVLVVVLLGFIGRSAYAQVSRVDAEEIVAILKNALQPEAESGWWEEQAP